MSSSSSNSTTTDTTTTTFVLYHYDPSGTAAALFVALFTICAAAHAFRLIRNRTWFFIPFLIGLLFEAAGYEGRNLSASQTPNWTTGPYILQSLTLLLGPTLLAASIYMSLGRLILVLNADEYSIIKIKWLTKVFVLGDVLSFFTQSGGGGMLASASSESSINLGEHIITGGLLIQIIFFGFFMVVTLVFHRRISANPTPISMVIDVPWRRFIHVLYAASILIMVRSIFRVIEYAGGYSGPLQTTEAYIYIFDATLMFLVAVILFVWHPSNITSPKKMGAFPLSDNVSHKDTYPLSSNMSGLV